MPTNLPRSTDPRAGLFTPARIAVFLAVVAAALAVVSMATQFYLLNAGDHAPYSQTFDRLDVDEEGTVPAWFSTSLLLGCGIMLAVIANHVWRHRGRFGLRWALLTLIFVALSIDESCSFHEIAADRFEGMDTSGIFAFLWVWLALPIVLVVGLFYLTMVISLPRRIAVMFTVAGLLYVGGALGFEAFSGWVIEHYGVEDAIYIVTATIEESMEMGGAILFLYALMRYHQMLIASEPTPTAS